MAAKFVCVSGDQLEQPALTRLGVTTVADGLTQLPGRAEPRPSPAAEDRGKTTPDETNYSQGS